MPVVGFLAAGEHQVCLHAERAFSCIPRSQHGLHQASVGHLFGPCETGDGTRREPTTKKSGRSFTGAIIGPFSTGADQSRPFNPEGSGVTTELRPVKVDVQPEERHVCMYSVTVGRLLERSGQQDNTVNT